MCTHLTKRQNRYSIRRKIPVDLQSHYRRTEIVKALGTSDRREAERLCRAAGAKLDEEFANVRAQLAKSQLISDGDVPALLSPPTVNADEVASHMLGLLRQRREAAATGGYQALASFLERTKVNLEDNEAILRGELEPLHSLSTHEGWRNALRAFLTGDGSVKEQSADSSSAKAELAKNTKGTGLAAVCEKWANERKPIKRTIGQADKVVGRFVEYIGDIPVEAITRRHVIDFKDKLLQSGQTPANTNNQLVLLSTLLNFAAKNSIVEQNPAKGISVEERKNAREARLPFDLHALNAIFSSPVYSQGERPKGGKGEAAYWLPLLALFTGARVEELAQLHPDDVYEESYHGCNDVESRVWVLRITDKGPGQALKNPGSRRRLPVHAELIRLGFIDYAQKAKGKDRIFDKLHKDVVGDESGNWSKWFGDYLRTKAGVTDRRMVFHSFRHTFKDVARAMEIPEDVSDAITGHSGGKVSRRYGGVNYPLRPLVEALNRFRIPGLMLPRKA